MGNYGLTLTGYVIPTPDDIVNDINTLMRAQFGTSLPLDESDPIGFLIGIFGASLASAYEANQAAWSAVDRDAATGAGLDAVTLLTGTFRANAASSKVTETFCGVNGTAIPTGTAVNTASTGIRFVTQDPGVLLTVTGWVTLTGYTVGQRVTANGQCYQCTVAGISGGASPSFVAPTYTGTDGSVTWAWIGTGNAAADIVMVSATQGAFAAVARDLTVVTTPTAGLNTAFNLADAVLGRVNQSDAGLRLAAASELAIVGDATPNALRAALLATTGVTGVNLFYNNSDVTDANGTPPHSCNALVQGGTDVDVANTLFNNVPVGIGTIGTTLISVLDSQGQAQPMRFTRAIAVPIYIRASITKLNASYGGDTNMKSVLAVAGNARVVGSDAVASALSAAAFAGDTSVIDVPQVLIYTDVIGTPVAWVTGTVYSATVGARSVVTADGGRCYICTTGGTSGGTGPSGVGSAIVDGGVTWAFLGNTISIDNFHNATYDTANITIISTDGVL